MKILTFLFIVFVINRFILSVSSFQLVTIEPIYEYYDKRESLLVTCNGTLLQRKPRIVFSYDETEYVVPRVNSDPFVYIGNLTVTIPKQNKVNLVCIDDNKQLLGSKLYFFGYPPEAVLTGDYQPKLKCRDFNLQRITCCLSPTADELVARTGFSEEFSGINSIELIDFQLGAKFKKLNDSCYGTNTSVYTFSVHLQLVVISFLGNKTFDFLMDRVTIMKPERPLVRITKIKTTEFEIHSKMSDVGEFMITANCSSDIPIRIIQNYEEEMIVEDVNIISKGWLPFSKVSCEVRSQILFAGVKGELSDPEFFSLTMPEAKPNCGPMLSPALMTYDSQIESDYIQDIVVYFIDIPLQDRNGLITKYLWKCTSCNYKNGYVSNKSNEILPNIREIRLDKARIGSLFLITACTRVGCSSKWSEMHFQILSKPINNNRIYVMKESSKDDSFKLFWYFNNQSVLEYRNYSSFSTSYFLLCSSYISLSNSCTSLNMVATGNNQSGHKSTKLGNLSRYAFITSLKGSNFYHLNWIDCIYQESSVFKIEKRLSKLNYNQFVHFNTECNLISCQTIMTVKVPPCEDMRFAVLDGIYIHYQSSIGEKNLTQYFKHHKELKVELKYLKPSSKYTINVSIISSDNQLIPWFRESLTTDWWTVPKLVFTCFGVAMLMIILGFLIHWSYKKCLELYFEKKYERSSHKTAIKQTRVKPLDLNNADMKGHSMDFVGDFGSHSNSPILNENTHSTNIITTDCTDSSWDSEENQQNSSPTTSGSYMKRPDIFVKDSFESMSNTHDIPLEKREQNAYMHLVFPNKNEKMAKSSILNNSPKSVNV